MEASDPVIRSTTHNVEQINSSTADDSSLLVVNRSSTSALLAPFRRIKQNEYEDSDKYR